LASLSVFESNLPVVASDTWIGDNRSIEVIALVHLGEGK
jgi:hypothetical protein